MTLTCPQCGMAATVYGSHDGYERVCPDCGATIAGGHA